MSLSAELRIDVLDSFSHLQSCLEELSQSLIDDEGLTAWMQDPPSLLNILVKEASHRAIAVATLNQLEYAPKQEPREILVTPGFIGASSKTIELAKQLNLAKDHFKQSVLKLRQAKISIKDPSLNSDYQAKQRNREKPLSQALQKMGLSKLHLKQCYRKIPILSHTPLKISWTWAHTRSIKRVSVAQAQIMLQKKSKDAGVENQLSLLSQIPAHEPLAIVQELAPHLRANILFPNDCGVKPRLMIKGPIPILFPAQMSTQTPKFKPPKEKVKKDENRHIRNDVRLDPKPFLPAIRAHRYVCED